MILQALCEYYRRKPELPPLGFEEKEIAFVIVLDEEGRFIQVEDTREGEGRNRRGKKFLVPQGVKRAVNIAANILWDNSGYVLGVDTRDKPERTARMHAAFRQAVLNLGIPTEPGVSAVLKFLDAQPRDLLCRLPSWPEVSTTTSNISFRLAGYEALVCQSPLVRSAVGARAAPEENESGMCLVTGGHDAIERLHSPIKGVRGAQSTGGNIVSFNLDAFKSYGKDQGTNAPVGRRAAFAYSTALNHLLGRDSRQRLLVGDTTTVFGAERSIAEGFEALFADLFDEPPKDDPDRGTRAVESLLRSPHSGVVSFESDSSRFYVLGLAPNASRLSVRLWHVATVGDLARQIGRHFHDLEIIRSPRDRPHLSIFRLLVSTAALGKADNIAPNLAGDFMRAVLAGTPYPRSLLQAAVLRTRAEHEVPYARAALIKASLNRQIRHSNPYSEKELTVALDDGNTNIGYRLGRLFAALEKIQEEASPGINATIRDRYYGAASSTPVTVFQTLLRLKNHHLAKLDQKGRVVQFEKLIGQIMSGIADFPFILPLADQGRFSIGYYHQRQAFFEPQTKPGQVTGSQLEDSE